MVELTRQRIETILLKRAIEDKACMNILATRFSASWFDNKAIGHLIQLALVYYKKTTKLPTKDTLDAFAEHYEEKHAKRLKLKQGEMSRVLHSAVDQSLNDFDDVFINESMLRYIKDSAFHEVIFKNYDDINKSKDLSKTLDEFHMIETLTFDIDLGMMYFEDWDDHADFLTNPESKMSTGFKNLDEATYGGFLKNGKCLIVPIAQAGMGKSMFLSNLAVNFMKQGMTPLIISLEMSEDIYAQRIDAHISKVGINKIKHHIQDVKSSVYDFRETYNCDLVIKEYPPSQIDANTVQAYVDKLKVHGIVPDVIIIDYISLLNPCVKSDSMYSNVGSVAKELRALSYVCECPVISPQQINGEGIDSTDLSMRHMSESKAINFHADFIGALCQAEGDREVGILRMILLKNRLGGQIGKELVWAVDYENLVISDYESRAGLSSISDTLEADVMTDDEEDETVDSEMHKM